MRARAMLAALAALLGLAVLAALFGISGGRDDPEAGLAAAGPTCDGLRATIVGTQRKDVIEGTPGPDVIVAKGGNDVIREVAEMTPGPYFHIGADEVYVIRADDYQRFVEEVEGIVAANGKQMIGWEEISAAGVPGTIRGTVHRLRGHTADAPREGTAGRRRRPRGTGTLGSGSPGGGRPFAYRDAGRTTIALSDAASAPDQGRAHRRASAVAPHPSAAVGTREVTHRRSRRRIFVSPSIHRRDERQSLFLRSPEPLAARFK